MQDNVRICNKSTYDKAGDRIVFGLLKSSYYILHRHHHTKCHVPFDYGACSKKRNDYVFCLVDECSAHFLALL